MQSCRRINKNISEKHNTLYFGATQIKQAVASGEHLQQLFTDIKFSAEYNSVKNLVITAIYFLNIV
jgi:hypothetical protein